MKIQPPLGMSFTDAPFEENQCVLAVIQRGKQDLVYRLPWICVIAVIDRSLVSLPFHVTRHWPDVADALPCLLHHNFANEVSVMTKPTYERGNRKAKVEQTVWIVQT